jgi:hypothetical protein
MMAEREASAIEARAEAQYDRQLAAEAQANAERWEAQLLEVAEEVRWRVCFGYVRSSVHPPITVARWNEEVRGRICVGSVCSSIRPTITVA